MLLLRETWLFYAELNHVVVARDIHDHAALAGGVLDHIDVVGGRA